MDEDQKLTPEQAQAILLFQIEQKIRFAIADQVEKKFHGKYHNESHDIAQFIRNMAWHMEKLGIEGGYSRTDKTECICGYSSNYPYCDNTHLKINEKFPFIYT